MANELETFARLIMDQNRSLDADKDRQVQMLIERTRLKREERGIRTDQARERMLMARERSEMARIEAGEKRAAAMAEVQVKQAEANIAMTEKSALLALLRETREQRHQEAMLYQQTRMTESQIRNEETNRHNSYLQQQMTALASIQQQMTMQEDAVLKSAQAADGFRASLKSFIGTETTTVVDGKEIKGFVTRGYFNDLSKQWGEVANDGKRDDNAFAEHFVKLAEDRFFQVARTYLPGGVGMVSTLPEEQRRLAAQQAGVMAMKEIAATVVAGKAKDELGRTLSARLTRPGSLAQKSEDYNEILSYSQLEYGQGQAGPVYNLNVVKTRQGPNASTGQYFGSMWIQGPLAAFDRDLSNYSAALQDTRQGRFALATMSEASGLINHSLLVDMRSLQLYGRLALPQEMTKAHDDLVVKYRDAQTSGDFKMIPFSMFVAGESQGIIDSMQGAWGQQTDPSRTAGSFLRTETQQAVQNKYLTTPPASAPQDTAKTQGSPLAGLDLFGGARPTAPKDQTPEYPIAW